MIADLVAADFQNLFQNIDVKQNFLLADPCIIKEWFREGKGDNEHLDTHFDATNNGDRNTNEFVCHIIRDVGAECGQNFRTQQALLMHLH